MKNKCKIQDCVEMAMPFNLPVEVEQAIYYDEETDEELDPPRIEKVDLDVSLSLPFCKVHRDKFLAMFKLVEIIDHNECRSCY